MSKARTSNDSAGSSSSLAGQDDERRKREPDEWPSTTKRPSSETRAARLGHSSSEGDGAKKVCVARIGAAHGVRGQIKLWTFTEDPFAVTRYGVLSSKDGARQFEVTDAREAKGYLVATLKGVSTRHEAERLNGLELYIARDRLPATDQDEYYHADLIGLAAVTTGGEALGKVIAIHNFGAGDIIEIAPPAGHTMLLPFSNAVVPTVDVAGGRVVIDLPQEIEGEDRSETGA